MTKPAIPAVSSTNPASGNTGVDVNSNVTVVMSQKCSGTSTSMASVIKIVDQDANTFTGTTTFDPVGQTTFTFDPTGTLNFSKIQTVKISGIVDTLGQFMTPTNPTFTTAASPVPPAVASSVPASGSSNFTISNDLTVTMDKVCSGVTSTMATVLSVTCSGVAFPGTVTFNTTDLKTFTLNPTTNLAYSMPSVLTVSGIRDNAGNMMTPVDIPFTTGDPALNNFYSVSPTITTHRFDNSSTRHAEKRDNASTDFTGKNIRRVKVYLKRTTGTPNVTISCVIRKNIDGADGGSLQATIGTMSSLSLTSSFDLYTFTNLSNSYLMNTAADAVSIEATLTGSDEIGIETGTTYDSTRTIYSRYDGTWHPTTSEDLAGTMYT
jgi:hypothetical protein